MAVVADAWSLLNQRASTWIFPAAEKHDVGTVLAMPPERGLLATCPTQANQNLNRDFSESVLDHVGKIKNLCLDYEIPMVAVALQWCLRHPMVSTIIPAVSNPEEALQNLEAVSVEIPDQFWNDMEPLVMDLSNSKFVVDIKDVIE